MFFQETRIRGAYVLDLERREDQRGFFARAWCQKEFAAHGLNAQLAQINVSFNRAQGTLRGMHYQLRPHQEAKVVTCIRGAICDVIVDLRQDSPTYLKSVSVELAAENRRLLYVPEGCAHGFQTLASETDVLYLMSEFYAPAHARGFRYNDPAFGIAWPLPVANISDADRAWPDYDPSPQVEDAQQ